MMLDNKVEELIKELPQTSYGMALNKYLEESKNELNNVTTIKSWEEALGRQEALKIINKLFAFMGDKKIETRSKNPYV